MAAPTDKPAKTSPMGRLRKPIYTRTSVLCNGQIAWKVGRDKDMEYDKTDLERADLRPVTDVTDDLRALNSLQIQRTNPLTPIEIKQPLRHVQSSLPSALRAHIYTGDLYGSAGGVFHSCSDSEFEHRLSSVFANEIRGNGNVSYNDFFRRLRRAEWLLWDVEAEKGHWAAVIAHLYKGTMRNPNKEEFPDNPNVPAVVPFFDFNRIDEWCVVTARRSPRANAIEGVRRWLGVKEKVRSSELRPRRRDSQAYLTGQVGKDGGCIPVVPSLPLATDSDDLTDDTEYDNYDKVHGGPVGPPPSRVTWWDEDTTNISGTRKAKVPQIGEAIYNEIKRENHGKIAERDRKEDKRGFGRSTTRYFACTYFSCRRRW
ncbi:hypothetical protein F5B17DRAFT_334884 [Nemania serpens]|nr:hypothetical protein F5B17DRAFT_334884 [Nemania serpens]